jgi:hypothetical protein
VCCSEAAILLVLRQRLRWYLLQHTATSHCMQHTTATHCNTLLHRAATHYCNTLQHTTTHCNTLKCAEAEAAIVPAATHGCIALQHTTATHHCDTLQHTALCRGRGGGCVALQYTIYIHCCNTLLHIATAHYNTLQCTTTHCNTPETVLEANAEQMVGTVQCKHTASTHCNPVTCNTLLRHTATHCNTLQHTATHCNTLQHTATHQR